MVVDCTAKQQRKHISAGGASSVGQDADTVYKIVEVVGVSAESWEDAGRNAVETAAGSLRDLLVLPQKPYLLLAIGQTPEAGDLSRGADISSDNEIAHLPA
jgi:hypothetical protein